MCYFIYNNILTYKNMKYNIPSMRLRGVEAENSAEALKKSMPKVVKVEPVKVKETKKKTKKKN